MTGEPLKYFLFIGAADSESATTQLRVGGARYRKKLLDSKPDNWAEIASLALAPENRGTLMVLTRRDYETMCMPPYEQVATQLLDALVGRPHIVFIHEAVFMTEEQRNAAAGSGATDPIENVYTDNAPDYFYDMPDTEFFGEVSDEVRTTVNTKLRERGLNVMPYRTNVERSAIAQGFLEDNERQLLFRVYVPSGRLYAREAEALLSLFREWLGETGRGNIRQQGYSTKAGQVFEFFSGDTLPGTDLARTFDDFSSFLANCVEAPAKAANQLATDGLDLSAATLIVSNFGTRARRLDLDLRQSREQRLMSLKHQFENVMLETEGLSGEALQAVLNVVLPPAEVAGALPGGDTRQIDSRIINNYNQQFIGHVVGSAIQSASGTINLGTEARQLLDLVSSYGGDRRTELETAVHELEDSGARAPERITARSLLKGFISELGNRGVGTGLDILQKYVEHKIGLS